MKFGENITYWGEKIEWEHRNRMTEVEKEVIGISDMGPKEGDAKHLYTWHGAGDQNARQIADIIRGPAAKGTYPKKPSRIQ